MRSLLYSHMHNRGLFIINHHWNLVTKIVHFHIHIDSAEKERMECTQHFKEDNNKWRKGT